MAMTSGYTNPYANTNFKATFGQGGSNWNSSFANVLNAPTMGGAAKPAAPTPPTVPGRVMGTPTWVGGGNGSATVTGPSLAQTGMGYGPGGSSAPAMWGADTRFIHGVNADGTPHVPGAGGGAGGGGGAAPGAGGAGASFASSASTGGAPANGILDAINAAYDAQSKLATEAAGLQWQDGMGSRGLLPSDGTSMDLRSKLVANLMNPIAASRAGSIADAMRAEQDQALRNQQFSHQMSLQNSQLEMDRQRMSQAQAAQQAAMDMDKQRFGFDQQRFTESQKMAQAEFDNKLKMQAEAMKAAREQDLRSQLVGAASGAGVAGGAPGGARYVGEFNPSGTTWGESALAANRKPAPAPYDPSKYVTGAQLQAQVASRQGGTTGPPAPVASTPGSALGSAWATSKASLPNMYPAGPSSVGMTPSSAGAMTPSSLGTGRGWF